MGEKRPGTDLGIFLDMLNRARVIHSVEQVGDALRVYCQPHDGQYGMLDSYGAAFVFDKDGMLVATGALI